MPSTGQLDNASSGQLRSSNTPSEAFQKHPEAFQELINSPRKAKKRKHAADEHWQKRRCGSVPEFQLSEKNLKKLERDLGKLERGTEMDPGVTTPDRGRKRAPSRQASCSDLNQDTGSLRSQKSAVSNSLYRFYTLDRARIFVHPESPPMDIQAQIDVIFKRQILEERRREISGTAQKTTQDFISKLRGAHREDDLVDLVYEALHMMYGDETFGFPKKAEWNPSLIPGVPREVFNWDALNQSNNQADGIVDRPHERQQEVRSFPSSDISQSNNQADGIVDRPHERQQEVRSVPSSDISQSTMPPPAIPSQSKKDVVKTPRPDFTIGLRHSTMSDALVKRGLSRFGADEFLKGLQRGGKLCSDPTQNFLNIRFPLLVIEGKAYATGKTIFEAQNRAAVSGSCMVNLQQQLASLYEDVFPNLRGGETQLAFSICTEGPQIEFWVHYALSEDNVRNHYMNIFRTCYGSLQGGLEDFLLDVERLMTWTKEEFLREIADQLYKLANHAARG